MGSNGSGRSVAWYARLLGVSKRHFFHFYLFLTIFIFANSHKGFMNFTVNNLEQFLTLKMAHSIEFQYRQFEARSMALVSWIDSAKA
jgi:hypothetical protein